MPSSQKKLPCQNKTLYILLKSFVMPKRTISPLPGWSNGGKLHLRDQQVSAAADVRNVHTAADASVLFGVQSWRRETASRLHRRIAGSVRRRKGHHARSKSLLRKSGLHFKNCFYVDNTFRSITSFSSVFLSSQSNILSRLKKKSYF